MRLWSIHPAQLDRRALVAGWREGLLAQKVLAGQTKGYRNHPQLQRFRAAPEPMEAIATYLWGLVDEADRRGYSFDRAKLLNGRTNVRFEVADGQLTYEWKHLCAKVIERDPVWYSTVLDGAAPQVHPMMNLVPGPIAGWEVV